MSSTRHSDVQRALADERNGDVVRVRTPIIEDVALSLAFFTDPDSTPLYLAQMKPAYR